MLIENSISYLSLIYSFKRKWRFPVGSIVTLLIVPIRHLAAKFATGELNVFSSLHIPNTSSRHPQARRLKCWPKIAEEHGIIGCRVGIPKSVDGWRWSHGTTGLRHPKQAASPILQVGEETRL
jgi:hypothetical protein